MCGTKHQREYMSKPTAPPSFEYGNVHLEISLPAVCYYFKVLDFKADVRESRAPPTLTRGLVFPPCGVRNSTHINRTTFLLISIFVVIPLTMHDLIKMLSLPCGIYTLNQHAELLTYSTCFYCVFLSNFILILYFCSFEKYIYY